MPRFCTSTTRLLRKTQRVSKGQEESESRKKDEEKTGTVCPLYCIKIHIKWPEIK